MSVYLFRLSAVVFFCASFAFPSLAAEWEVAKSSGKVWIVGSGVEQVALSRSSELSVGSTIQTGKNGRVLLIRGKERILVEPNSSISLPSSQKDRLSTTVLQQAGSILLDVEKKNVKHFEVETPFLAAVVKGTQFRVSVDRSGTKVDVLRGKVDVHSFKTGQYVGVLPGQAAKVGSKGVGSIDLRGSGQLNNILQGAVRQSSVRVIEVPKGGIVAPIGTFKNQAVRKIKAKGGSVPKSFGKASKKAAVIAPAKAPGAKSQDKVVEGKREAKKALKAGSKQSIVKNSKAGKKSVVGSKSPPAGSQLSGGGTISSEKSSKLSKKPRALAVAKPKNAVRGGGRSVAAKVSVESNKPRIKQSKRTKAKRIAKRKVRRAMRIKRARGRLKLNMAKASRGLVRNGRGAIRQVVSAKKVAIRSQNRSSVSDISQASSSSAVVAAASSAQRSDRQADIGVTQLTKAVAAFNNESTNGNAGGNSSSNASSDSNTGGDSSSNASSSSNAGGDSSSNASSSSSAGGNFRTVNIDRDGDGDGITLTFNSQGKLIDVSWFNSN